VCGLWLLRHRLQEAVHVESNSAQCRRVALGPQRKQGAAQFKREFLGPKKYTLTTVPLFKYVQHIVMHKHLRRVCKRYYGIGNVQVHFIYNNNDDFIMANNLMFHLYLDQFIRLSLLLPSISLPNSNPMIYLSKLESHTFCIPNQQLNRKLLQSNTSYNLPLSNSYCLSNFIGFLSNGGYSFSWLPLPTKSYTPVLRHICLNASIPTFLLTPCDHHPPLTCTSLALIFISVHARFFLQLQQSGILSLLLFVCLKP